MRVFNYLHTFCLVSLGLAGAALAQNANPLSQSPSADEIRARQLLEEKTRELDAAAKQRPAPRPTPAPAAPTDKELKAQEKAAREKAIADQKAREEQERQERINKIKADLAAQGQATPKPAPAPAPAPVPAPAPAPAPTPQKVIVQPTDADAQARSLLEQKTRELEAATPVVTAPVVTAPAVTTPAASPVVVSTPASIPATSQSIDDPSRALLEQATRESAGTVAPQQPSSKSGTGTVAKSSSSKRAVPVITPAVPEVASPLPPTKQQRLSDLLETYRMNLITPADYHAARAKILAEP